MKSSKLSDRGMTLPKGTGNEDGDADAELEQFHYVDEDDKEEEDAEEDTFMTARPLSPMTVIEHPNVELHGTNELYSKYLSELPGYDVEAIGQYKWVINNFSKIRETKTYSEDFKIGDKNWRLLMFSKGNNCDFLSLYLDFSDSRRLTDHWSSCAQFALIVVNPHDESAYIHKEAKHRFNPDESDWGFTQFMKLSTLYNDSKIPQKDFLVDDTLIIVAVVRIIKDTTGNLWHNFLNYDSKQETGYVGLKNQGATCYMNSILQSLYFLKYFRRAVFKMPTENDDIGKSVPLALQRIFYQLQNGDQAASTTELTKSFGWDTLDSFMQHDVQEFNRVLCDNLETKMKGTPVEGTINDLFEGKMKAIYAALMFHTSHLGLRAFMMSN